MSDFIVVIVLVLIAALLAGITLLRNRGQELLPWAVLALALAVLVDRL
jgi:hypothetical protein